MGASRRLNRNQFVLNKVQLDQLWANSRVFEMKARGLTNVVTELFPRIAFGEDGVPERSRGVPAFFRFTHLEEEFHGNQDNRNAILLSWRF